MQAYGGSYSSVTYSGNIRNEIGVMRFLCNEVAVSDSLYIITYFRRRVYCTVTGMHSMVQAANCPLPQCRMESGPML